MVNMAKVNLIHLSGNFLSALYETKVFRNHILEDLVSQQLKCFLIYNVMCMPTEVPVIPPGEQMHLYVLDQGC